MAPHHAGLTAPPRHLPLASLPHPQCPDPTETAAHRAFSQFTPWFDEINALVDAEEFEQVDDVYDLIEGALTLESPSGPIDEFLLHIDQDRAWFRWDDGPATSQDSS
ncbi:hypothetical protein [Streptomyces chryseus]